MKTLYTEVLYDISMSIGLSLNKEEMLTHFLKTFLRKTNSSECGFVDENKKVNLTFPYDSKMIASVLKQNNDEFLKSSAEHNQLSKEGYYFHSFVIGKSGYLILVCN